MIHAPKMFENVKVYKSKGSAADAKIKNFDYSLQGKIM